MAHNPIVTIEMEDGGVMKAELYPDVAPNTVNSFMGHASATLSLWGTSIYWGCRARPYTLSAQSRDFTMYLDIELQL